MILDPQQKAAVKTESAKALVLAGPGAGKTRVIVERAAHLVENCGVSPYDIALLTFTRKAAQEMRERIEERIGKAAYKITCGTFHSIALQLLHRYGELIGFKKSHGTVYGDFEEQFLLKEIAKDIGLHTGKAWKKIKKREIDAVFYRYYTEGIGPEKDDPAYSIFKIFVARCKENNSYTYGSLLVGLSMLIPHIAKFLSWKHIIVDESHDNNMIQWNLIEALREALGAEIYVVCDLDQSIYKWRGAFPEYILENQDEFDIFRLEINYRSDAAIVKAADHLIQHNTERIGKTMEPFHGGGDDAIKIIQGANSEFLAGYLHSAHQDGYPVVVLARNHFLLKKLSGILNDDNVPHTYVGQQTALTNSEEFRRFHAFLKLVVNPFDNFSFLLIRDLIGLSKKQYNEVRLRAAEGGKSHFQAWMNGAPCLFSDFFRYYKSEIKDILSPATWQIKYMATGAHPWPDKGWGFDSTNSFKFIMTWLAEHTNGTIQEYLDYLAVYDIQNEIREGNENIQLMTIHAAKGLEFENVIIAGANEQILPSKQSITAGNVEEERRLMYVACTRAENKLIITVRPERTETEFGKVFENPKSRFVDELMGGN